jgi:hypothetical protein
MLVAEKTIELSWVSVRDRLPFDGHECALICRGGDCCQWHLARAKR